MTQSSLDNVELASNPEPRCAVVLLLDTSGSMSGAPIQELNRGLQSFSQAIKADKLASLRVEIAVITFGGSVNAINVQEGGMQVIPFDAQQAFAIAGNFQPPTLNADGETPMGEAVRQALALLRARKDIYKQQGLDYYRPWILLITDGNPTDNGWEMAADQVQQEGGRKSVTCFCVGVQGADMQKLARFALPERPPLLLSGLAFEKLFVWLSKSLSAVSGSRPGEQVPLPPPGWMQV